MTREKNYVCNFICEKSRKKIELICSICEKLRSAKQTTTYFNWFKEKSG